MGNEEQQQQVPEQTPAEAPAPQDSAPQEQAAPIKLDMSKSVAIAQPGQSQQPHIKLDLSKSTPISAESGVLTPPPGGTTISAQPSGFHSWLQNVQGDVKNGTDSTWVGSMLKKFGAKGTNYGNSEGVGDLMAGPALGVPKALEGATELAHEVKEGVTNSNMNAGNVVRGVNKVVGGAFQSIGPAGMIVAPEGEALAVVTPAIVAQNLATKTAIHMGADQDTAELVGNVAGIVAGHQIHASLHPVIERFGVAVNNRTAAEVEYTNRSRNLETARGQAAEVHQRAVDAAQAEATGKGTPQQTDQARQLANEAAKNVGDAQKAFDQSSKNRADATIELEKLHRQISSAADKTKAAEYERTASDEKKASDLFRKAVPSKGSNQYSAEDEEIFRSHMEAAKAKGAKINNLESAYEAGENGRQGVEDKLAPKFEKYEDEPLVNESADTKFEDSKSPKNVAAGKLAEMAQIDGNFSNAMDHLSEFKLTDPTVGEARETLTKINNYQRAASKGKNNWDIYNMIETDPAYAARFFYADALRDALYSKLEEHGVEGAREARKETASLIRVRDAIGAQMRANRGGTTVRGSGNQNALRGLLAKLTGKAIKGAGIAGGAELAGPAGAIGGGALGEMIGQPIEDFIAPRELTRDQHIEKSMKYRGTNRKPIEIKGEGTPAVIPTDAFPPAHEPLAPEPVTLTPRENTELHAKLAAHFGVTNLDSISYEEMENNLRKDIDVKKANGQEPSPKEQALLAEILKADVTDRAARAQAGKSGAESASAITATAPAKTPEQLITDANNRADNGPLTKLNPHLVSLGRGDESALVSHSTAMRAHAPAAAIAGLPEGVTSEDAHIHEWAHNATAAVDGLKPLEIRSDLHPKSEKGSGATSVFDASEIRNPDGSVNEDELRNQMTQWLTQKMAGPASHEVFKGMTREEVKASPATRSDFREARATVREVHPEFSPSQVEAVVDAAYERSRDFLNKPHIADRIRANAAVREEGLSPTLHASNGRVNQFAEDIRNAHSEFEGNDNTPNGTTSGEGGEKAEKPAAEGKEKNAGGDEGGKSEDTPKPARKSKDTSGAAKVKPEESKITTAPELRVPYKEGRTPPGERPITPEVDERIRKGGAIPGGLQKGDPEIGVPDLAFFHDPTTGSTLALPPEHITPESIKEHLQKSRDVYLKAKPEESRIPKPGQPGYDPELHGDANVDKSNISTDIDHNDVLDNIKRAYGVHDDPKLERAGGFITPDGRFIDLPGDHTDAIEEHGGGPAQPGIDNIDNRKDFINESKAIRVHKARERGGSVLAFSVPKDGVNPAQADAMARSFGANGDRNGLLRIERADISPETRNQLSAEKEFPRPTDVKDLLEKIKGQQSASTPTDWTEKAAATNGEGFSFHPATGEAPKDGYMVEIELNRGKQFDHPPTAEDIRKYVADNKDILDKNPDLYVGGYKNTLGLSKNLPDQAAAEELGKNTNQISIYDVKNGKEISTGGTGKLTPEMVAQSDVSKSPKGSSVPLMKNPLEIEGTRDNDAVSTLDVAQALNKFSKKQNPALDINKAEPKEMVDRAKKISEDEAKYQLAQGRTGKEWYTEEMKDHDKVLQEMRPELNEGPEVDAVPGHTAKMTLFKAVEAVLSSGQKPYSNLKGAIKAWDAYHETGEFPPINPATGKSWGPRNVAAYGNAIDMVNRLVSEKGEKGAADWLLADHTVKELRSYNADGVKGKMTDTVPGAMILGAKRGPFMQNLHGIESAFTADMWVARSWNRWMGTIETRENPKTGETEISSDSPRNGAERDLMKQSFEHTAKKLNLTTSSLQAVLWYYEQALYRAHGVPKESWSFSDAAKRVQKEQSGTPENEEEQTGFNFGDNADKKTTGGLGNLGAEPKRAGAVNAFDFLHALGHSNVNKAETYQVPKGWSKTGPAKAPGLITPGNIDLTTRPVVKNDDGTHSSENSVSFEDDKGHEVLVPTVVDGKFLTPDGKMPAHGSAAEKAMYHRAWEHYKQSGQHLGIFDTPEHADAVANQIHSRPLKK